MRYPSMQPCSTRLMKRNSWRYSKFSKSNNKSSSSSIKLMIRPRRWLNLRGILHSSFWWIPKNSLSLSKIISRTKRERIRETRKRRRKLSRRKRGLLLKNLLYYQPYQKQRSTNTLLNQSTNSYKKCSRKKLLLSLIKHSVKTILSGQASKSVSTHSMIRFTSNWSLMRFYLKILMKTCLKSLTILY